METDPLARALRKEPASTSLATQTQRLRLPGRQHQHRRADAQATRSAASILNFDSRLGKSTSFHERYKVEFSADFFNLFNHVNFFQPSPNLQNPATFGVISQE
jgi:hypothetical protein